jgi:DUF1680 family protein
VADVYVETGDASLLQALERLWAGMVATKTYLTGGIRAHHGDEAFYELPQRTKLLRTCAAIASIMFAWRMLMITGEAKYANLATTSERRSRPCVRWGRRPRCPRLSRSRLARTCG